MPETMSRRRAMRAAFAANDQKGIANAAIPTTISNNAPSRGDRTPKATTASTYTAVTTSKGKIVRRHRFCRFSKSSAKSPSVRPTGDEDPLASTAS